MTISAAAFGRRIGWEDDQPLPGHKLSFKRSVQIVGSGVLIRVLCPKWLFELAPTKKIREARDGFAEFQVRTNTWLRTQIFGSNFISMRTVLFNGDDPRTQAVW